MGGKPRSRPERGKCRICGDVFHGALWAGSEVRAEVCASCNARQIAHPHSAETTLRHYRVGDVECTECGRPYWSGDGHPNIVLCTDCWLPRPFFVNKRVAKIMAARAREMGGK